jgi:hypothetical protein
LGGLKRNAYESQYIVFMTWKYRLSPVMAPSRAKLGGTMKSASHHHHSRLPCGGLATSWSNDCFAGFTMTMFAGTGSSR